MSWTFNWSLDLCYFEMRHTLPALITKICSQVGLLRHIVYTTLVAVMPQCFVIGWFTHLSPIYSAR